MAAILKFKNIFKSAKGHALSYRHNHFLNTLPQNRLNEIMLFSEAEGLEGLLPESFNKRTLFFNNANQKYILKKILNKSPAYCVNYLYSSQLPAQQTQLCYTVMGDMKKPAFRDATFDLIICPLALENGNIDSLFIKKLSQLLKNGGRLILSLRHPQLEHMLLNQNPAETHTADSSITGYFNLLKANALYTEEMIEGRVDNKLKPFFNTDPEQDNYSDYKNAGITLLFKAVKFVKTR